MGGGAAKSYYDFPCGQGETESKTEERACTIKERDGGQLEKKGLQISTKRWYMETLIKGLGEKVEGDGKR